MKVEWMAAMAAKLLSYGVRVHSYLHAVVIMVNTKWAAHQTWGADISVTHRKINARYKYNHVHDAKSTREILRIVATEDTERDRQKFLKWSARG